MSSEPIAEARTVDSLVLRLYQARKARDEAKQKLKDVSAKVGSCDGSNFPEDGPCYFKRGRPMDEWCDVCKAKQPAWEDWQAKSALAGTALRAVLSAGKKLSQNPTGQAAAHTTEA